MKKSLAGSVIVLLVFFLSMGLGFAGNGNGAGDGSGPINSDGLDPAGNGKGGGNGAGDGTGPIHDIFAGTSFTYYGEVIECQGDGMVIATETENVTVYGIGPVRYWDDLELIRPVTGDIVTVSGYAVDYNGVSRNIAVTITVGGVEVPLRDLETGVPLWRQAGQK